MNQSSRGDAGLLPPQLEHAGDLYSHMRWNAPLSNEHADLLLRRVDMAKAEVILDLGCGWGELLLRAAAASPSASGIGVDTQAGHLERGRRSAAERGLRERVTFHCADAATWMSTADRVICIGASHAWGDSRTALPALARVADPSGLVLFGDGFWEQTPSEAARGMFGDGILHLDQLIAAALDSGWRVVHLSTADQREWDDFESTWRAGREAHARAHPSDPATETTLAEMNRRLFDYVSVYRSVLGFAYMVLARTPVT
jgi:cyclopropane fatty-acyl-phospholipid synthase-like methyltransferase